MKTFKTRHFLKQENVSLSSLHLSGNWIDLTQFVEFIEEHFLEKLHVRGRFRCPRRSDFGWYGGFGMERPLSPREILFRTDIDLILSK